MSNSLDGVVAAPVLPGPTPPRGPMPLLRFLKALRDSTISTFSQEAYEQDIVARKILGRRIFVLSQPAAIKHVLIDNAANYRKTEITRRVLEPGLGKGLITLEGDTWKSHRRTMSPAFDLRSVASYTAVMTAATQELLAEWRAHDATQSIDIAEAMMEVTLKIISRTMFSSDSADIMAIMGHAAGRYQATVRPNVLDLLGLPDWLAGFGRRRAAQRAFAEFDAVIDGLIDSRARDPGGVAQDLLARLISARDDETGGGMSAQDIRDHVITMFMAGHETTAMALTWTWYLLSVHPAEEAKLHAELHAVLGKRAPAHEDLDKLVYTRMVIEESMRIYPAVPAIEREATAEDTLVGLKVPKGSVVLIVPWVLHRHQKLWKNPGRFDPERFAHENAASRERFSYLPFGGGKRICIGAAFATTEAMILLATLAQHYQLRAVPGHPIEPQGLITLRARHGIKMNLNERS